MKKVVLIYGVLSGVILIVVAMLLRSIFGDSMVTGYVTMVVALAMIFFGIKSYRDQHLGGRITFGQGFKVGILIALIASVFYVVSWEIYMANYSPNFMADYTAKMIEEMKASGASAAEISEAQAEMAGWTEMYKNPLIRYAWGFAEIFPVGLLITLISAGILRRRNPSEPSGIVI